MEYSTGLCLFLSVFLPLVHHSVQQGLCYDTMEIVIVVDGSYSIEEDTFYGPVKNVLRSFSSRVFNLGTSNRMGLVLFSHELDYTVNLTGNITEFQTEVSNLKHPMGGTGTFLAIKAAATMLKQYGRRNVPKIMLVITDGESSDTGRTKQEAMTAKADNIIIYAAWVGDLITQEIRDMATSSQHIINAVDYTQLEKKLADLVKCIVNGGWTDWQVISYGTCSVTCGVGTQTRNDIRYCTNPAPSNGGQQCQGSNRQTLYVQCNTNVNCAVAVNGGWTDWQFVSYGSCSVTCGVGTQNRNEIRYCTNPAPSNGGQQCQGSNRQTLYVQCNTNVNCPVVVNGGWTDWQFVSYGSCSVTCGVGTQNRNEIRYCTNPAPSNGGQQCQGSNRQTLYVQCNTNVNCPVTVNGGWTDWQFVSYGSCSVTCGVGTQNRNEIRYCTNPAPSNGGQQCQGSNRQTLYVQCNTNVNCAVAVDGGWTDWQLLSYGSCSVTCGVGTRTKNEIRYCTNPAPSNGGKNCLNNDRRSITVDCDTNVPCKITGLCQNAKLIKGVGYRLHPTDCDKFIQCYYRSTGYTLAVIRTCSYGQFWDQNQARCRPSCFVDCPLERCKDDCVSTYNMDGSCRAYWSCNNGKSEAKCCPMGFAYVNKRGCLLDFSCREECPVICTNPEVCDLRPVWTNTHNFEELKETAVWIEASCLRSSLYFDIIGCHCSASSTRDCSPRMTMDFSNPNRLNSDVGISVSSSNLHVTGGIGVFNGNSQITTDLKVPQPGYPISIRFMYRETSPVSTRQVLVSAPWCRMAETVAMVIYIESGVIGIEVKNWYGTQMKMTIPTNGFSDKEWKDVLFAYDGKFITATVQSGNNKHVNRAYAPNQQMVECGINFGTDGTSKFFSGWMDNIRVYQCDPSIPKYN